MSLGYINHHLHSIPIQYTHEREECDAAEPASFGEDEWQAEACCTEIELEQVHEHLEIG